MKVFRTTNQAIKNNMKENDKLNELTLEELQTEKKKYKNLAISFGIVILLVFITAIYFAFKNNSYSMFIYLGGFSGVTFLINEKFKKIETEIKSRNSQS